MAVARMVSARPAILIIDVC
jgi:hypothetical protein